MEFEHGPRERKDDYDTSSEGAKKVSFRAGKQQLALLEAHYNNPRGLNDYEAAVAADLDLDSYYHKRCGELRSAKTNGESTPFLEWIDERRPGAHDVSRRVSKITPYGVNYYLAHKRGQL